MPTKNTPTTPAALKLKTCAKMVRINGVKQKCEKQYLGADSNCPNSSVHLQKYPTGFCGNGQHEGTKVLSPSGKPMKTCEFFVTCPCDCHAQLDKLFVMTGQERILVDASGYQPPPHEFTMPSEDPEWLLSRLGATVPLVAPENAPTVPPPGSTVPAFGATPTGRAARGQLESWVWQTCKVWIVEQDGLCTPQYISDEIARREAIDPPSVGAVHAVFERWIKLGFAVIEKKPTRFVRLTPDGQHLGLERMKIEAKLAARRARAEQRRGSLR